MAIPREVIEQFEKNYKINSLVLDDFSYTAQLSSTGDFKKFVGKELAIYRLAVLLSTLEGTDLMDPELGVNLLRYIFRPLTPENINAIEDELRNKIQTYEKDLNLISMKILKNEKTKSLYFNLHLKYTPSEEDVSLDFDFVKEMQTLMLKSR